MSASSKAPGRMLVADSGVPACEVTVLDGRFTPVANGVGKVEATLAPGLYKVRYKIGGTVVDESKVIELEPGGDPLVLPVPHLSVKTARPTRHPGSPAPDIATKLSLHVDKEVGAG